MDFFIPTRKHFAKRQQLHKRPCLYETKQSPSSRHTKNNSNELTPSLTAFRRKKALHGIQVDTPKFKPIATPSHTKHRP
ncbi:unnamed protein product [Adineta steineri]|uniref:Uncharacterized protein n=1 Tax=Adineta steineri TaxID=433720 RepID=A0A820CPQ1_9BILA|nr:unnamed protein product [Adineta steineri]